MKIYIASSFSETQELANKILEIKPQILGLDTETTCGLSGVSLLQLATFEEAFLFQIRGYIIPSKLLKILSNPNIVKVGVDLDTDISRLSVNVRSGIDLQAIARTLGHTDLSLEGLGRFYIPNFSGKDPLGHRGNWDGTLTEIQKYYAAMDAYHPLLIYQGMIKGIKVEKMEIPEDEAELYFIWVKSYLEEKGIPIAFKSLVNYTINSYAPWRKKYIESERREKAIKFLTQFKDRLKFDGIKFSL